MTTSGVGMTGMPGSFLSGLANAGATPPPSALKEMTAPEANTATVRRQEQVLTGVRMWISTPLVSAEGGDYRHHCFAAISPDTGNGPAGAAVLSVGRMRRLWRSDDPVPTVRSLH